MAENPNYSTYTECKTIFKESQDQTIENYNQLKLYFDNLARIYGKFVSSIQKFEAEFLPKGEKGAQTPKFTPSKYDPDYCTVIGQAFPKLASSVLMQEAAFQSIASKLSVKLPEKLQNDCDVYKRDFVGLYKQFNEALDSVAALRKVYDSKHDRYFQAGDAVKEVIKKKKSASAINKHKSEFKKAKQDALEAHKKLTQGTADASVKLEKIISEFEDLEKNRALNMKLFVEEISQALFDFSDQIVQGKAEFINELNHLKYDQDLSILLQDVPTSQPFNVHQQAETADCFQLVRINPLIGTFLKPEDLFPTEVGEGKRVLRGTQNYKGVDDRLDLVAGELVVVLDEGDPNGEFYRCKNVNDSIGLLPKNLLA